MSHLQVPSFLFCLFLWVCVWGGGGGEGYSPQCFSYSPNPMLRWPSREHVWWHRTQARCGCGRCTCIMFEICKKGSCTEPINICILKHVLPEIQTGTPCRLSAGHRWPRRLGVLLAQPLDAVVPKAPRRNERTKAGPKRPTARSMSLSMAHWEESYWEESLLLSRSQRLKKTLRNS